MDYKTMMEIKTENRRFEVEEMILGMADIVYENRRLRRELNEAKYNKEFVVKNSNIEQVINEIKYLLKESERNSNNAAYGYDEGWYNGECNAYEIALEMLEDIMR